jgi:hypothetical protein
MEQRKFLPSISELIDRLAIDQIKEVLIPEYKEKYAKEIQDILHDIDIEMPKIDKPIAAEMIRLIIIIGQINLHIWYNEAQARKGEKQDLEKLKLTHGLNGIRNEAKNRLLDLLKVEKGKDFKVDCLSAEFKDWKISW